MTTLALLIEIYLPCEFYKFSLSHSLETPETGAGCPLNTNIVLFITRWNALVIFATRFLSLKRQPKTAFERMIRKRVFSSYPTLLKISFERVSFAAFFS